MKLISGVLIEGWNWRESRSAQWEWMWKVTHYSVEFSPDGRLWTVIKDEHGNPRVRRFLSLDLSSISGKRMAYG